MLNVSGVLRNFRDYKITHKIDGKNCLSVFSNTPSNQPFQLKLPDFLLKFHPGRNTFSNKKFYCCSQIYTLNWVTNINVNLPKFFFSCFHPCTLWGNQT